MNTMKRTASGLIVPKKKVPLPTPCLYCPNLIWLHNEVENRVHLVKGKPACITCRTVKFGSLNKQYKKDKRLYAQDLKAKEAIEQEAANQHAIDVAIASQEKTKTQMIK